jgi:pimeloyl-ACP methyl ester carboxylesterase
LDLPGHGNSEGDTLSFRDYWKVVAALLEHLGINSCAVCGLSKGVRVAVDLALHRPEYVNAIIMVNSFMYLRSADREERIAIYRLLDRDDEGKHWANVLLREMGVLRIPNIARGFNSSLKTLNRKLVQRLFFELAAVDQREELHDLNCPVIIVSGAKDHFVPAYYAQEIKDNVRHAEIKVLEDCGHLPYLEQPDKFNAIVEHFLFGERGESRS